MAAKECCRHHMGLVLILCAFVLIGCDVAECLNGSGDHNATTPAAGNHDHVWPGLKFGWRIAVGSIVGFLGAAFGSVGGVGGGGIFVPMLTLIIGFDAKSSTALSKCMITGASVATVYYNLKRRHPSLDLPIIDYDLALLIQPMLVLGISIGVGLNVLFAYWMITILLIVLFLITSTRAFLTGIETWKKETINKKEAAKPPQPQRADDAEGSLPEDVTNAAQLEIKDHKRQKVPFLENVHWKEFGLLCGVWISILSIQIAKSYTTRCLVFYWLLDLSQFPIAGIVTAYEAVGLYKGQKAITSKGDAGRELNMYQLVLYCTSGLVAGIVGGLLGLGGGFIMGPVFLELGIPPQVSSATATFVMVFSSSMSVIEYYLLKRFPIPYALYLTAVTTVAALVGQHIVRKAIDILGRASLIIFILALTIFTSAIFLGGIGLSKMVEKIQHKEYMGFESMCHM
uniref:Sulfite exporter TauE/SafE family protein n=2 Tax=Kalanchoe fedtschenkoi TaxID=63787 RepID=A0A7N0UT31_KALFE